MSKDTNTPTSKKRTSQHRQGVRLTTAQRIAAQEIFLKSFAANGNVRAACIQAGIDRSTVYQWQEHDTEFGIKYTNAKLDVDDAIRGEIYRRAMFGEEKLVTSMGKVVYYQDKPLTVREKSDTLLMFHAKSRMPEYRDKQQLEVTGKDGGPIKVDYSQYSTEELATLEQLALRGIHGNS